MRNKDQRTWIYCYYRPVGNKLIDAIQASDINFKILGAAQLDLCHVAEGKAVGYIKTKTPDWDFLAGMSIVKNAGGKFINKDNNIIASNDSEQVLQKLLAIMNKLISSQ